MFKLFKKKTKLEKLQKEWDDLMKEAFILSKSNRAASDAKYSLANRVLGEIERLESENNKNNKDA